MLRDGWIYWRTHLGIGGFGGHHLPTESVARSMGMDKIADLQDLLQQAEDSRRAWHARARTFETKLQQAQAERAMLEIWLENQHQSIATLHQIAKKLGAERDEARDLGEMLYMLGELWVHQRDAAIRRAEAAEEEAYRWQDLAVGRNAELQVAERDAAEQRALARRLGDRMKTVDSTLETVGQMVGLARDEIADCRHAIPAEAQEEGDGA